MKHLIWVEKYRPCHIDDVVGMDDQLAIFKKFIVDGTIPNIMLFGTPGCGKTTIARILMNHIECDTLCINASDENSVDVIRTKVKSFAMAAGFAPMKIVLLEEADHITRQGQAALRALIEETSEHTRFIFTCNYISRIIDPLISRLQQIEITLPSKAVVAQHVAGILRKEDVEFENSVLKQYINAFYPDLRKTIGEIQLHSTNILHNLVKTQTDATYSHAVIVVLADESLSSADKFTKIRQLLADAKLQDYTPLFRLMYDNANTIAPRAMPLLVLALAEGQFRQEQVPDKEINAMAVISQLIDLH